MEQVYEVALKIALPASIAALVVAIILYLVSRQMGQGRQEMRTLRISLEHDPSPAQVAKAAELFPDTSRYTGPHRITELARQAGIEEGRRVERIEMMLSLCRIVFSIAVLLAALVVAGKIWPPGGRP